MLDIAIVRCYIKEKRIIVSQSALGKKWMNKHLEMDLSGETVTVDYEGLDETIKKMREAGLNVDEGN